MSDFLKRIEELSEEARRLDASAPDMPESDLRLVGLGPPCLLVAVSLYVLHLLGLPDWLPGWVPNWVTEYTGFLMVTSFAIGLYALVVGALFKGIDNSPSFAENLNTTGLSLLVFIAPIILTIFA